jgi:hypothetical protein
MRFDKFVGVGFIDRDELDPGGNEGQVTRQPVQLGYDQLGFLLAACVERPHPSVWVWRAQPSQEFWCDTATNWSGSVELFRPGRRR